jgi:membrane-associated phospholipid phosphatase
VFLLLTITATAYFGWHYLIDDVAGLAIGAASVVIASASRASPGHRRGAADERELERLGLASAQRIAATARRRKGPVVGPQRSGMDVRPAAP